MPQDRRDGRRSGQRLCAGAAPYGLIAAVLGLVLAFNAPAARAQSPGSDSGSIWNRAMRSIGLQSAPDHSSEINYTERPPLVVPPTRALPPPSDQAPQAADWPRSSPRTIKHARTRGEVIPDTAVQNPNPPFQKKPWYNPAGWFSKEEYASFSGEPVRRDLTEPPAGYRVPSAEQPYGISPDKKGQGPLARPAGLAPVGGESGK